MNLERNRYTAAEWQALNGNSGNQNVMPKKTNAIRMPVAPKMTKAERDYIMILRADFKGCEVHFEPMTFRLPSGCRYTPDAVVMEGDRIRLLCEIKGAHRLHSAGRSAHAFKEALAAYPNFKWRHASKSQDGWVVMDSK